MSNGVIVRLVPLSAAMIGGGAGTDPAFPVANLADPQPKEMWRTPAASDYAFTIDLGQDTPVDTVGLLFTNAGAAASMLVTGATQAEGAGMLDNPARTISPAAAARPPASSATTRFHALRDVGQRTLRHLKFFYGDPAPAGGGGVAAGIAVVGQTIAIDPAFNFDLGAGRRIDDLSDVRQLPGGEFAIWQKARVPLFRATWSQLTDAELRGVWALLSEIGTSAPLLLIEDPDATAGLQERIHYGLLDGLDFYARTQEDKSSIELRVRQWL